MATPVERRLAWIGQATFPGQPTIGVRTNGFDPLSDACNIFLSTSRRNGSLLLMAKDTIKIMGIDTSLRSTGVGIIEARGSEMRAIAYGRIRNKPSDSHSLCLENIFNSITELIMEHAPDCASIEGAFFAKNAQTAMVLGQARGAAITACAKKGLAITEHSPRKVKQSIVGTGAAQKDQVAKMVMRLLNLSEQPQEDAADALAIAICHYHQLALPEELRAKTI